MGIEPGSLRSLMCVLAGFVFDHSLPGCCRTTTWCCMLGVHIHIAITMCSKHHALREGHLLSYDDCRADVRVAVAVAVAPGLLRRSTRRVDGLAEMEPQPAVSSSTAPGTEGKAWLACALCSTYYLVVISALNLLLHMCVGSARNAAQNKVHWTESVCQTETGTSTAYVRTSVGAHMLRHIMNNRVAACSALSSSFLAVYTASDGWTGFCRKMARRKRLESTREQQQANSQHQLCPAKLARAWAVQRHGTTAATQIQLQRLQPCKLLVL